MPPGTWIDVFGILSEAAAVAEEAERLLLPTVFGLEAALRLAAGHWPPAAAFVFALTEAVGLALAIDRLRCALEISAEPGREEERVALLIVGLVVVADRIFVTAAARDQAILRLVELAAVVQPEIFDKRRAVAAFDARAGAHVDRQRHKPAVGLGRGTRQRHLRRVVGPDRLHDRIEDRQRHARAGIAVPERLPALHGGVVVADPDTDGDVFAEAHEPGVVKLVAGAGFAADHVGQRAEPRRGAAGDDALQDAA